MVPELASLLAQGSKYGGRYAPPQDKQFVIVCGNISFASVSNFLGDFYHPAREDVNAEVVFLNKKEPDLEFDGLLKREKTRVKYFQVRAMLIGKMLGATTGNRKLLNSSCRTASL